MAEETESVNSAPSQENFTNLSKLVISRVLAENSQRKSVCALGTFEGVSDEKAVIHFEKQPFNPKVLKGLCSEKSVLERVFLNDIYGSYSCFPDADLNGIKTTIIYPATDQHIAKYEEKPRHLINETPELYQSVTVPYILKDKLALQWVYNILEHKEETDRIVFEDTDKETGFILLPDLKWNGKQVEDLYLLAIVRKHDIMSLRDLTDEHIPLLRNILEKGTAVIHEKYGLLSSQLRIYLHYQPSFYHLHVHFTNLAFDAPGIYAEKSHLLTTVINNLELLGDYYQKATLPFVVNESQGLFSAFNQKGLLVKECDNSRKRKLDN